MTVPSGPVSEGNAASFSGVVSRRGCSSTETVAVWPRPAGTVMGTISSANRPSSVAAIARILEWNDQWSDSSRVMPHSRAVFSPTVMSMFVFGASGESGWLGGRKRSTPPNGNGDRSNNSGDRVMDSTPPATTTSAMPAPMLAAASCTAIIPVAHCRCTAPPGVSGGRPRALATYRAVHPPPWRTSPRTRSSMSPGSSAAAAMAAATVCPPSSWRVRGARLRPARPMGLRTAATITASVMVPPGSQARTKTGMVYSSEMGWNFTVSAIPTRSWSNGQSTTLVIIRGPSARSTMAATYGTRSRNGGWSLL